MTTYGVNINEIAMTIIEGTDFFSRLQSQLNTVRVVRERWEDDGTFDET